MSQRNNQQSIIQVIAPPDAVLFEIARNLLSSRLAKSVVFQLSAGVTRSFSKVEALDQYVESVNKPVSRRISHAKFTTDGKVDLQFDRGVTKQGTNGHWGLVSSAHHAEFMLVAQNRQDGAQNAEPLLDALWDALGDEFYPNWSADNEMASAMAQHVANLGATATDIGQLLAKAQLEQQDALVLAQRKQSELLAKKEEELQRIFDARSSDLDDVERRLEERRQELDDRQARHARRELRKTITDGIQHRLQELPASNAVRWHRSFVSVVIVIGLLLSVFSAIAAGVRLDQLSGQGDAKLFLTAARFFGSSALAAALIFYWLSYRKRIADDDARFERQLELFSLDINRASWAIETIIEFQDEAGAGEVPEAWLKGVTSNMFEPGEPGVSDETNALEALGALLKTGVRLEAGGNGFSLTTDPKSSKKIGRGK